MYIYGLYTVFVLYAARFFIACAVVVVSYQRIPRNAPRFPLLPWEALCEKRNSGLQQVHKFGMEICSSFKPAPSMIW